jgi:hypothetical protein
MITKESLEASFFEDRKKLIKLREQIDLLMRERIELEKIVQSEEILLKGKFGFNQNIKPIPGIGPPEKRFENKSTQDAAFEILIESGNTPTHIRDIYKQILEGGKKLKNQSSVSVGLNRDSRFKKVGPNTFVITEEEYKRVKEGR